MRKTAKLLALMMAAVMFLSGVPVFAVSASTSSFSEESTENKGLLKSKTFQDKTPSEFTPDGTDIEVVYQQEGDNIYWYAGHDTTLETGGWQYAKYSLSEMLDNATFTSGEYTVSFRFKCDNATGWGQNTDISLLGKSGGVNANFNITNIRTLEGSASTETTKISFNDTELAAVPCRTGNEYFIQSGAWYTMQVTYNLDQKKATFNLYDANNEPVIETVSADLPASEITLTDIQARLDSRYLPQMGLDDITVSEAEEKESVTITCNIGDHGTVTVNGQQKENGESIAITKGDTLTVVAEPDNNYRVSSVKLGDIAGVYKNESYIFENVLEDAELVVTFAESSGDNEQIINMEDFQSKTPSEFTPNGTDIEVIYQQEGENIYWYAGHAVEASEGNQQFAAYSLSDLLNNASFTSGEYTVSFRFKCDNTTGWSQKAEVRLLAKSGGSNANFRISSIETKAGGAAEDKTIIYFNDTELMTFLCRDQIIESGQWYTVKANYNLDQKKATFHIYNADNEPIIDSLTAELPSAEISFTRIQAGLDSRYLPQIGVDDIIISKTEKVPVVVSCNVGGKVVFGDETVTFRDGGKSVAVDYNSAQQAEFQIVPDEGYEIESVVVNGNALDPVTDTISFSNLLEAQSLKVVFAGGSGENPAIMDFYVAPDGDDSNSGDIDHPMATLTGVRDRLRTMEKTCPIKVYFREGIYPVSSTVVFNERDSGTEECPITYAAYPGETVKFSGSVQLDASKAKKVTDPAILNRLVDENAKDKLMSLDLGEQGIGSLPIPPDEYGRAYWFPFQEAAVFYDGMELTAAKWPNDRFLTVDTVDAPEDYQNQPFSLTYHDDSYRTKLWSEEALAADDVYIGMRNSFSFSGIRLASVSPEDNGITSKGGSNYKAEERCMFYFFNVLDEIDMPGESYMDRENKILYYLPPNDNQNPTMEIAALESSIISLNNTSYLNFEGLTFDGSKEQIVTADTVNHIHFNGCEFSRSSNTAMYLKNITNSTIENCHIFDAGNGGIRVEGSGDRMNLVSGNLHIENNKIHNTDRFVVTYAPGIYLENCVGNMVEHNEIYEAAQMLINIVACNDVQFNYNEIYDAATLFDDTGAIYFGRDMSIVGIEIKYNYFHDIGNILHSQYGSSSIFCDDFVPGPKIYGNIFYHGSVSSDNGGQPRYDSVVRTYFGQYMQMQNNIIIDAPSGFAYATNSSGKMFRWLMALYSVKPFDFGFNLWDKIKDYVNNPAWEEHYGSGQWSFITKLNAEHKDQLDALSAKYNYENSQDKGYETEMTQFAESLGFYDKDSKTFSKNLLVKVDQPIWAGNWALDTVLVEQNHNMSYQEAQTAFENFGTDVTLTDEALEEIRKTIPDFEKINFDDIGLQSYTLNGVVSYPGGMGPTVSDLAIEGEAVVNGLVNAEYQFSDADSDLEGYSKIT